MKARLHFIYYSLLFILVSTAQAQKGKTGPNSHSEKFCNLKQSSYSLSNAIRDEYSPGFGRNGSHSLVFRKFNGGSSAVMAFDAGSYLTFSHEGEDACITGVATMTKGNLIGSKWKVYIPFNPQLGNTRAKKELKASAYDLNIGGIDPKTWYLFVMADGAYIKRIDAPGKIKLSQMPSDGSYGLQVGYGANGKNIDLGASTWFSYSFNGQREQAGDVNIDMTPLCTNVEVSNVCTFNSRSIKWAFRNNGHIGIQAKVRFLKSGAERKIYIPASGKGEELYPGQGDFSYRLITTPIEKGTSIQLSIEPFTIIEYTAEVKVCPLEELEIVPVCSKKKDENLWRIANTNLKGFNASYINAQNDTSIVRIFASGKGQDIDGQFGVGGNYTFLTTSSELSTLSLVYGASNQKSSASYTSGPCSIRKLFPVCSTGQRSFEVSSAEFDSRYSKSTRTHSFYLPGFNGGGLALLQFDSGAYFTYKNNGRKAFVHGTATMSKGNMVGSKWEVFMPFSEKTPNVSPKVNLLKPAAFDPNDGNIDTSIWKYFSLTEDAFLKQLDGDGYIHLRTKPANGKYGLQVGQGANLKNIKMGASTWFYYTLNGQQEKQGDMNITLDSICAPLIDDVTISNVCTTNPRVMKYAIRHDGDKGVRAKVKVLPDGEEKVIWLPKKGKGKELVPGDGDFAYRFYRAKVQNGTILQLTLDNKVITYEAAVKVCDINNISLSALCTDRDNKNKWGIVNSNDHGVLIEFEKGGQTKTRWLPKAGKGKDIDGNPKSGNYTFIYTNESRTELSFTYGNEQSITEIYSPVGCDAPVCEPGIVSYTLSNAISDDYHAPYDHNFSLFLYDLDSTGNTTFDFDEKSYLTYHLDGSEALVYGTAVVTSGDLIGSTWQVYMPFEKAGANTVPKTELVDATAYEATGGGADTTAWYLFLLSNGGYLKQIDGSGYIALDRSPSDGTNGLQIGKGANGKNVEFGASSWFAYSYNNQAYKQGDINVDINPYCPSHDPSPVCADTAITYTLSNAVSDEYHEPYNHDLSLWLSDLDGVANTILDFEDESYITYNVDGSQALVYGTATVSSGHLIGSKWEVYMPFGQAAANTIPKTELVDPTAYEATGGGADTTSWIHFLLDQGAYLKRLDGAGYISLDIYPADGTYGFQVGKGANGKNVKFGAGGWFLYSYNGQSYKQGDINVNMDPYCPPPSPVCTAEEVSYKLSNAISDSYHAPYNHNQSLWLSGFDNVANTILDFEDDAFITYSIDGSQALVYGTVTVSSGHLVGSTWEVYMPFGPAAANTIPKTELTDPTAYEASGGGADTTSWIHFLLEDGAYLKRLDDNGYISLSMYPADGTYGLQIGKGANGKNVKLGASGWFLYSYNGQGYKQGDINVNIEPICVCDDYAHQVISYSPGTLANGSGAPVAARQNTGNAIGAPQENETINFVALGFGGELVLEMSSGIYDHNTSGVMVGNPNSTDYGSLSYADFIIVETTFGRSELNCGVDKNQNYPEKVLVYGKQALTDSVWISMGASDGECRTSFIDVAPAIAAGLEYVKYIRLVDVTESIHHISSADGYDVDGLIICPESVTAAISGGGRTPIVNARGNASTTFDHDFFNYEPNEAGVDADFATLYPNPVDNELSFMFASAEVHQVEIRDLTGSLIESFDISSEMSYDVSKLKTGVYLVTVVNSTGKSDFKFEKR